jgi:hypothetical protein
MHPNYYSYTVERKPTLEELQEQVIKTNEAMRSVFACELRDEIKNLVIKELHEKKAELINLMHQIIDEP